MSSLHTSAVKNDVLSGKNNISHLGISLNEFLYSKNPMFQREQSGMKFFFRKKTVTDVATKIKAR